MEDGLERGNLEGRGELKGYWIKIRGNSVFRNREWRVWEFFVDRIDRIWWLILYEWEYFDF